MAVLKPNVLCPFFVSAGRKAILKPSRAGAAIGMMPAVTKFVENENSSLAGIDSKIHLIRGKKVMLDADLAELYGVETKYLNKAVGRNIERFPGDFMFRLTAGEWSSLRFQIGTSSLQAMEIKGESVGVGGRRYTPFAFTQEGVAMLSGVLKSDRAVLVNVEIMRSFVRLRSMAAYTELAEKLEELEEKYDRQFKTVFDALRELMSPRSPRRRIGFHR